MIIEGFDVKVVQADLDFDPTEGSGARARLGRPVWRPGPAHARPRDRLGGPRGGRAGLGRCAPRRTSTRPSGSSRRTSSRIPVQPGSLGLEAMLQLLQFHMLHAGLGEGMVRAALRAPSARAER